MWLLTMNNNRSLRRRLSRKPLWKSITEIDTHRFCKHLLQKSKKTWSQQSWLERKRWRRLPNLRRKCWALTKSNPSYFRTSKWKNQVQTNNKLQLKIQQSLHNQDKSCTALLYQSKSNLSQEEVPLFSICPNKWVTNSMKWHWLTIYRFQITPSPSHNIKAKGIVRVRQREGVLKNGL